MVPMGTVAVMAVPAMVIVRAMAMRAMAMPPPHLVPRLGLDLVEVACFESHVRVGCIIGFFKVMAILRGSEHNRRHKCAANGNN
jgi:hypothetical protein